MALTILQINTADTKGGAGKVAYRLKKELKKQGHNSVLLISRKYSKDNDVKLIRPDNNLRRRGLKKLAYYLANDLDLFPSGHILKMPEFKNADIIHCHNLHSNYFNLSTLQKISRLKPVVWTFHDMWPITAHCAHAFDGPLKENGFFACPSLDIYPPIAWHNEKYLEKKKAKIYANSNFHIVTPSKWLADKVSQSLLKNKPISVIYNGVDTNIFNPLRSDLSRLRSDLNLPQDKKIVLVVAKRGQSNPWKGRNFAQDAITAFTGNPGIIFVDLGGDDNKTEGNVIFRTYVTEESLLAKYYSAADALLYPSIADNCPLVVLEAQACGLPVIAFATGGIPEIVDHKKTGYIAEYQNSQDLISGINWLVGMEGNQTRQIRFEATQKIGSAFTLEKMADDYVNLYKKLPLKELSSY